MFFCKTSSGNLEVLKEILEKYGKASGQEINYQKSAITFSRKAHGAIKRKVKRELKIEREGGCGKYLGLPEYFGRRKKDIFNSIVDRISQKAISWSNRFLSTAGKMIMLKSVLSAIPTYAMSSFKLPASLCKRIQSILTRFWWDKKTEERKMAWISWNKMTKKKSEGGLGFRDIQGFNDAMLAKLSWRILKQPNSLLAQMLMGKYCKNQDLMSCSATGNISHGWRGILVERDLLAKNTGWAIGNGEKVKVWQDFWLSTSKQEAPIGPPKENEKDLLVADLLHPTLKTWNQGLIYDVLPTYEQQIMSIQLSNQGAQDKLIWLHHYSGEYSVKSGYHAAISKNNQNLTDKNNMINWNSEVWGLNTAPKIKMFIWKAASGALPTGERLHNRKIIDSPACLRCGEPESILHLLFLCDYAKQVWENVPFATPTNFGEAPDFSSAWRTVKDKQCLPPTGIIFPIAPWILWMLWITRNQQVFNNQNFSVADLISKAIQDAREWITAQKGPNHTGVFETLETQSEIGHTTCKTDGAWRKEQRIAGLGWIFLDERRVLISKHQSTVRWVISALVAEGLAVREGLQTAWDLGIRRLTLESDSSQLIQAISNGSPVSELHGILFDIETLKNRFTSFSLKLIKRAFNVEADYMAKDALIAVPENTIY